jgi:hypothetical protein
VSKFSVVPRPLRWGLVIALVVLAVTVGVSAALFLRSRPTYGPGTVEAKYLGVFHYWATQRGGAQWASRDYDVSAVRAGRAACTRLYAGVDPAQIYGQPWEGAPEPVRRSLVMAAASFFCPAHEDALRAAGVL